jgi:hypothetical protein
MSLKSIEGFGSSRSMTKVNKEPTLSSLMVSQSMPFFLHQGMGVRDNVSLL